MAKNYDLISAKNKKNDEFYTTFDDISTELAHYKEHFRNKAVLCNCDNPTMSAFWEYFHINFSKLGLRKLIATYYDTDKVTYKTEYDGGNDSDIKVGTKTPLKGNGDFRSKECIEILKESDIIVTNPPFSLFREYVAQLIEYGKKFVIVGNQNAITYKEIFPLLKENKIWLGFKFGDMAFRVPDYYEARKTRYWQDDTGQKWRSLGNACWYTNLDISKRHEKLDLYKEYVSADYPKYDNYDAINVDKVKEIPTDYYGEMGVPITFMDKFNPEQFEIVAFRKGNDGKDLVYTRDGKIVAPYCRIVICRKKSVS